MSYAQDARILIGAFADKLPPADYTHTAFTAWKMACRLASAEPSHIAAHRQSIIEARDALDMALRNMEEGK